MDSIPVSVLSSTRAIELIGRLGKKFMDRAAMFAVAESCTGGLLAALCTEVPGSSAWFAGGVVSYADSVKESLLGVSKDILARHGAVSAEVVEAMARGLTARTGVHFAVSISGIAGPGGGSEAKPVGTVWIGLAVADSTGVAHCTSQRFFFTGNRQDIRSAAALQALVMVEDALEMDVPAL